MQEQELRRWRRRTRSRRCIHSLRVAPVPTLRSSSEEDEDEADAKFQVPGDDDEDE